MEVPHDVRTEAVAGRGGVGGERGRADGVCYGEQSGAKPLRQVWGRYLGNDDFRDATVYVYWSGVRARAGSVTGKTTQTFTMPWRGEYVQLRVDFLGSRSEYRTEVVPVDRGDHLNFVIMSAYGR
jgi:hypothetical protein